MKDFNYLNFRKNFADKFSKSKNIFINWVQYLSAQRCQTTVTISSWAELFAKFEWNKSTLTRNLSEYNSILFWNFRANQLRKNYLEKKIFLLFFFSQEKNSLKKKNRWFVFCSWDFWRYCRVCSHIDRIFNFFRGYVQKFVKIKNFACNFYDWS